MVTVKLKDIAKASGVSIVTVSAALNGTSGVGEKRKAKIIKIADELGYQPNIAARLLKRNKIDDMGFIIDAEPFRFADSGSFSSIINSFVQECSSNGVRNQIEFIDSRQNKIPQCLSGGLVGGALHLGVLNSKLRNWLTQRPDFPFVQLNEKYKYCATVDAESGIQQSIQYLAAMGHSKVALLYGPQNLLVHKRYYESFKKVAEEFRLEKNSNWLIGLKLKEHIDTVKESQAAAMKLLSGNNRPTAIICTDMRSTSAVIYVALSLGLKVPEDISIIGTGTSRAAEESCPTLTSIEVNWDMTVSVAMNILSRLMKGLEVDNPRVETTMRLVKR